MPFEIIGDFRKTPDLMPEQVKWCGIATGIVGKLKELEPKARFRLRNLHKKSQTMMAYLPIAQKDVHPNLHDRLEAGASKFKWVRQYFCKTCTKNDKNLQWVPQMYLHLHKGHELSKTEPTGKVRIPSWEPNYRLFIAAPYRLKGVSGIMYSGALTACPENGVDLSGFPALLLIPPVKASVKDEAGCEIFVELSGKPTEAVAQLLQWMKEIDKNLLERTEEELPEVEETASIEKLKMRVDLATAFVAGKKGQKIAGLPEHVGELKK